MDTKWERRRRNQEIGIDILTLCIKYITYESILYGTETLLSTLWRPKWGGNLKKRVRGEIYTHIHICICMHICVYIYSYIADLLNSTLGTNINCKATIYLIKLT